MVFYNPTPLVMDYLRFQIYFTSMFFSWLGTLTVSIRFFLISTRVLLWFWALNSGVCWYYKLQISILQTATLLDIFHEFANS